jgi:hypothetical protein
MNPAEDKETVIPFDDSAVKIASSISEIAPVIVCEGEPLKIQDREFELLAGLSVEFPVRTSKIADWLSVTLPYTSVAIEAN